MNVLESGIPRELFERAEAIGIFPGVLKAGFVFGGRGGDGVVARRTGSGWSPPVFYYAPWIEAQIHVQCPRLAPPDMSGHVIICKYDAIAPNLIKRLQHRGIPYFVIEPDPETAVGLHNDGISVVQGEIDNRITYERLRIEKAKVLFANAADTTNTNITLTIREIAPEVNVIAVAENEDSIDILELSGATEVVPLIETAVLGDGDSRWSSQYFYFSSSNFRGNGQRTLQTTANTFQYFAITIHLRTTLEQSQSREKNLGKF